MTASNEKKHQKKLRPSPGTSVYAMIDSSPSNTAFKPR